MHLKYETLQSVPPRLHSSFSQPLLAKQRPVWPCLAHPWRRDRLLPCWELTYPMKWSIFKMIFLFPKWDTFSSLKGNLLQILNLSSAYTSEVISQHRLLELKSCLGFRMSSCIYKLLSDFIITSQKKQKQIYHFTSHTTNSNKKISPQNTYSYHHWAINSNPLWWPFAAPHLWCHCCDPILRKIALAKPRGKTKGKTWHGGPNLSWGTGFLGQGGLKLSQILRWKKPKLNKTL